MKINNLNGLDFDVMNVVATVTDGFLKKAGKIGSPEYEALVKLRKDYPTLSFKKLEKKADKKMLPSIKYDKMKELIDMCEDAENRKEQFEAIQKMSLIQTSPYCFVRDWFLNNYANYDDASAIKDGKYYPKTAEELTAEKATTYQTKEEKPATNNDSIIPMAS